MSAPRNDNESGQALEVGIADTSAHGFSASNTPRVKALTLAEFRNQAEAAGGAIAHDMNNAVLNSADQAEGCRAIMAALNECFNPGNDPIVTAAAGGFSVAIVNVMESGLQAIRAAQVQS